MEDTSSIAIIGAGNIGGALAKGLVKTDKYEPENIYLTRRSIGKLDPYGQEGFKITDDNIEAVKESSVIILCVEPQQAKPVLEEIAGSIDEEEQLLISVVSDLPIQDMQKHFDKDIKIVRAMPNTAIFIGESMTCLSASSTRENYLSIAENIFDTVGETLIIEENQMTGATALGACGIAFFLRAIRAASQGGIEIGFHSEESLKIAANTAKGAAALLTHTGNHPEQEIDRVTTPRGCTIAGLNQMEHEGFSSALIKGIKTSANKATQLYTSRQEQKEKSEE